MFTPPKCVTCHMSHDTCHVSRVTCHVSRVTFFFYFLFYFFFFLFFFFIFYFFFYLFIFFLTKWWSLSVEGLSSTGLPRLVFLHTDNEVSARVRSISRYWDHKLGGGTRACKLDELGCGIRAHKVHQGSCQDGGKTGTGVLWQQPGVIFWNHVVDVPQQPCHGCHVSLPCLSSKPSKRP